MNLVEFSDPRLVAVYDTLNAYGPGEQPDFYAWLADDLGAQSILDVGCGTGLVTCHLAERGHDMIGIDPAPAMIEHARRRASCKRVRWMVGDTTSLGEVEVAADLAIMTGHVAQFLISDAAWERALRALYGSLRSGGHLAFETRNPVVRAWEGWGRKRGPVDSPLGLVAVQTVVTGYEAGIVSFETRYRFVDAGEDVIARAQLRFRSMEELKESLVSCGFSVLDAYGGWDRRPSTPVDDEFIIVAGR